MLVAASMKSKGLRVLLEDRERMAFIFWARNGNGLREGSCFNFCFLQNPHYEKWDLQNEVPFFAISSCYWRRGPGEVYISQGSIVHASKTKFANTSL